MNKVEEAVWNWKCGKAGPRSLVRKMVIQFAMAATLATLLYIFKPRWQHLSYVLWGFSGLFLTGAFSPGVARGLERVAQALAYGVGQLLTWLLLTPFYFLCFVPAHFLLVIRGKDPMNRRLDVKARTYWTDRPEPSRKDYFEKQF